MFKTFSIITAIRLFILTTDCSVTIAEDTEEKYTHISGRIKNINDKSETITVVRKTNKGETREYNLKISNQTKYEFVTGTVLEFGDFVIIQCKVFEGDYEAVQIRKIKNIREKVKS